MRTTARILVFLCLLANFPTSATHAQDDRADSAQSSQLDSYETQDISLVKEHAELGFPNAQYWLGKINHEGIGVDQDFKEAFKWWEKCAEQGHALGRNGLGVCYQNGQGVEKDYEEALRLFILAADQGLNLAKNNLGNLYERGNGTTKNLSKAFKQYLSSAESGNAWAQNRVGYFYKTGRGVELDFAAARSWYEKAAEQEYAEAQNNIGLLYELGNGVEKDTKEAFRWYMKSANNGYKWAQGNLGLAYQNGRGVEKDYTQAMKWYRKAAEQKYDRAQHNIGVLYYYGYGVERDYDQAASWYRKAAQQNHAESQNRLGICYENGNGVGKNLEQAVSWYKKAAERNFRAAQANLGDMYEFGKGVAKDYSQSTKWYRKAAEQGLARGQYELGDAYYFGQAVTKDRSTAVKWYRKAAHQNYKLAQRDLGFMYSKGQGVAKNQKESVNWYRKAAEQGDADSQYHLGLSYQGGLGVDKDLPIALDWYRKSAKSNYRQAQHQLGKLYEGGIGVKKNIRTAANWYKKASTGGLKDATQDLNRLVGNISPKAILIGFDSYDDLPNIQGQKESINKLVDTLQKYNQFGDFTIVKRNENPADVLKREIDAKLATQLVVFLSGHALEYDDGKIAIATPSTDPDTPGKNSLQLDQLSASLNALPDYTNAVVIVDCFRQPAEEDEAVGVDNLRILEELDSIKNVTVIAASSGEQHSHNVPDSRRNIFVESLCKGLQGAADEDENEIITSEELHLFLLDEVQDLAGNHGFDQAPEINAFGEDHPDLKLFDFRKPKPFVSVKLNNESKKKDFILHVRHQGKPYKLPGRTYIDLKCQSVSEIEYFAGKFHGKGKWRKLHPAPTRSYTFRTTKQLGSGTAWTAGFYNSLGVHMTLIYPGSFQMGFNQNDRTALAGYDTSKIGEMFNVKREFPAHTVKIDRPFYMGTYEITYGEFEKFVIKNAYKTDAEEQGYKNQIYGADEGEAAQSGYNWRNPGTGLARYKQQPVVHVTWKDAKRFCDALSLSEKASYALPTETQWEFAARGGTKTAFWNGNSINGLTRIANVRDMAWSLANNNGKTEVKTSDGQVYTSNIGSFAANPFGLHDVHGNVWEWCRNSCHDYPNPPVINDGDGL